MTREEDLIRSTTRAIAATVREAPPLQLAPATDELESPARAPRRGRGRPRHWWSWGAPLAAAAVVAALAIALVLVKGTPNGSAVPESPTRSAGPGAVPRYYVALKDLTGNVDRNTQRDEIVVGDSLTGKTLATFAPPARTVFVNVTAAADDRTFVVFGVTSSAGSFQAPAKDATVTGSWYEVHLAPGTAEPASLTRLPIKPQAVPGYYYQESGHYVVPPLHGVVDFFGPVLSGSGQELAVPEWAAPHRLTVKVFSVATGRLLHEWTANDLPLGLEPSLTWIDKDQKLAFASFTIHPNPNSKSSVMNITVREWPVAGPTSGDLIADSKVVWETQTTNGYAPLTTVAETGPVVISADGKTFACAAIAGLAPGDHLRFLTYPLPASTTATAKARVDYQVTFAKKQGIYVPAALWASPSGGTLIGALMPYGGSPAAVANGLRIGVISHGTFTPLRIPASLTASTVADITF